MMSWIKSEYEKQDRSPRALRRFGFTVGLAAVLLGALLLWRHRGPGGPFIVIGGILILVAAFAPSTLRRLHQPWIILSLTLGWIFSRVLLTVVFFLVLTPVGVLQRICGKRAIEVGSKADLSSYWQPRAGRVTPTDYEKQF
jgi:saxitoxin biosynthesis operon SxtJ-like protein